MRKSSLLTLMHPAILILVTSMQACAQPGASSTTKRIHFTEKKIASEAYESAGIMDVNNDGVPDIVSGSFWYVGPEFRDRYFIKDQPRFGEYYDDFSTISIDVNGDGRLDVITGGWFGKNLRWRENPGNNGQWTEHIFAQTGNVECTITADINKDGFPDIVPNTPGAPLDVFMLNRDNTGKGLGSFSSIRIAQKQGHGIGCGDVNGDGFVDIVLNNGWLESPKTFNTVDWKLHSAFDLGDASVPVIVADVNKDGLNDIIAGKGHDFGLSWYEQAKKGNNWIKHEIDQKHSQFHVLAYDDIDGDGTMELITGKRFRAHDSHDPGSYDDYGIYMYRWNGKSFDKETITFGPFGKGKGTGLSISISDINGDGKKDIVVPGKDGLSVFVQD
ncbi:MAG TPA: VCBS repeat-containing protein [Flavitalea sp.]|nr:VCBS repeat-containing protein [Flavitalea sp.]